MKTLSASIIGKIYSLRRLLWGDYIMAVRYLLFKVLQKRIANQTYKANVCVIELLSEMYLVRETRYSKKSVVVAAAVPRGRHYSA